MTGPNRNLMGQTVYRAAITARDSNGDPSFGATTSRVARQQAVTRIVRLPGGNEVRAEAVIYDYEPWTVGDRIWLSGEDSTNAEIARTVHLVESSPSSIDGRVLYKITVGTSGGQA